MSSRIIGIDLGAYSVKVVVANPGFRQAAIADYIERPVPAGDEPPEVRAARVLGEIVRDKQLEHDSAFAAISGDRVFSHVLEFGFKHLRRAELEKAVGAELEGILPIDLEDMAYAFEPLPAAEPTTGLAPGEVAAPLAGRVAAPTTGMRVLACATRRDKARALLDVLVQHGIEPRALIAAPASYPRVIERLGLAARPIAVIDVGHERTDVCVVAAGRTAYVRTIGRGGRHLTEAIARRWRLPFDQAEAAKHQDGFIASPAEPAESEAWARIHEALQPELAPLARDLRQTLLACRAKVGVAVDQVLLCGGGARLRGLASYLGQELGIPARRLSDDEATLLVGARLAAAGVSADAACLAAGVAFEGASGRPTFDLRQGELAFKADLSFLRGKITRIAAAALIVIGFAAANAYASLYKLRKAEKVLTQRLAVESAEAFGSQLGAQQVLDKLAPTTGTDSSDSPLPKQTAYDLVLALNAVLPPRASIAIDIEDLEIEGGKVSLRAVSSPSGTNDALKGIKSLEEALKTSKCFRDFASPESQPGPNDTRTFNLSIKTECM